MFPIKLDIYFNLLQKNVRTYFQCKMKQNVFINRTWHLRNVRENEEKKGKKILLRREGG